MGTSYPQDPDRRSIFVGECRDVPADVTPPRVLRADGRQTAAVLRGCGKLARQSRPAR